MENITIELLTQYLNKNNWRKLNANIDLPITIWKHEDSPYISLSLPINTQLSDYKSAMKRVILDLSEAENKTTEYIINSICNTKLQKYEHSQLKIENITINLLTQYLNKNNWIKSNVEVDLPITVWRNNKAPYIVLRVPINTQLLDYKSAMKRVILDLSEAENKTTEYIINSICNKQNI